MEKIKRKPLNELPSLKKLADNYEKWGLKCKKGKSNWRSSGPLYLEMRKQLELQTVSGSKEQNVNFYSGHCSFCDDHPIGTNSKENIEHYFPKGEFPCLTFYWENLFFCCNTCNTEANTHKPFRYTLKPDNLDYDFTKYFYFDRNSGEIKIFENLKQDAPTEYLNAEAFLKRYGINTNNKRIQKRVDTYKSVLISFENRENPNSKIIDLRTREDFAFRFVYDSALDFYKKIIKAAREARRKKPKTEE